MRNAGITFVLILLVALLFPACSEEEDVRVEGDYVIYTGMQPADSLAFRTTHHYWKGYRFHACDSVQMLTTAPMEGWTPDTLIVARRSQLVVADIAHTTIGGADSVWLKMVVVNDTLPQQGWVSEATLLRHCRPTHGIARLLNICGSLADVPGGRYPSSWVEFYFHPTANPWILPWPMAIIVVLFWIVLILFLGIADYLLIERHRYRCGRCNAPLHHLGTCPHCGAENIK